MPGAWLKPVGAIAGAEITVLPLLSTRGAVLSGITTGEVAVSAGAGVMVGSGAVVCAMAAVLNMSAAANNAVFILDLPWLRRWGVTPSILAARAEAPVDGGETIRFGFFSLTLDESLRVERITG